MAANQYSEMSYEEGISLGLNEQSALRESKKKRRQEYSSIRSCQSGSKKQLNSDQANQSFEENEEDVDFHNSNGFEQGVEMES